METICRHAKEVHLVVPNQPRACSYEELESLVPATFKGRVVRATVAGLFPTATNCTAGGPDDTLVVTGSIYLLGEVMARLGSKVGSPQEY
jgi:dihydrofolate synthase/folylpolyglutamate synthase